MDNITFYKNSYDYLLSNLPKTVTVQQLNDYLNGTYIHPQSMSDVLERVCITLQNYQGMKNYIGYDTRNKKSIQSTLFNFDLVQSAKAYLSGSDLFAAFLDHGVVMMKSQHSWHKYCENLVNAFKWLSQFRDFAEFDKYVRSYQGKEINLPIELDKKQDSFFGFALACDFLKELGYSSYSKPDEHILDIVNAKTFKDLFYPYHIHIISPYLCFMEIKQIAKDNGVSEYHLDKLIWSICSGELHSPIKSKIRVNKVKFLNEMRKW